MIVSDGISPLSSAHRRAIRRAAGAQITFERDPVRVKWCVRCLPTVHADAAQCKLNAEF